MARLLITIVLYVSLPLIFALKVFRKVDLPSKTKRKVAFSWGFFISTILAFASGYSNIASIIGFIAGGTLTGGIIGLVVIAIFGKYKGSTTTSKVSKDVIEVKDYTVTKNVKKESANDNPLIIENPYLKAKEEVKKDVKKESVKQKPVEEKKYIIDNPYLQPEKSETKKEEPKKVAKPKSSAHEDIPENQLRTLKMLYDDGVLTEEEYTEKKKQILGI